MPQTSATNEKIELGTLAPSEKQLLHLLRTKYRFGKVTIITHEGLPKRIEETVKYESLEG